MQAQAYNQNNQPYYPQAYPQPQYPAQYYQQQQMNQQVYYQQPYMAQNPPIPQYQQINQQPQYRSPQQLPPQQPFQPNIYHPVPVQQQTNNQPRQQAYEQPRSDSSLEQRPSPQQQPRNQQNDQSKILKCRSGKGVLEENLRLNFIRKVYCILLCQLLFTVLMVVWAYSSRPLQEFQARAWYLLVLAFIIAITVEIILFCYPQQSWIVPRNYILLSTFTVCEAWILSSICSIIFLEKGAAGGILMFFIRQASVVLMAAVLCFGLTLGLTLYACYTKTDYTNKGAAIFMFAVGFFFFGILLIFFHTRALLILYAFLGVCLYGLFLIYDTQLIMGGKSHEYSEDDYIIAALMLYIDVISMFLELLNLISSVMD